MLIRGRMFGRWLEVNKGERWVTIKVSINFGKKIMLIQSKISYEKYYVLIITLEN